ncbi:MAG TPA: sensor histidine kinase [Gemmatimonadaceae bacterium]|nr:sensor histidine kinase [Gemmatimonadaceae bacterium]
MTGHASPDAGTREGGASRRMLAITEWELQRILLDIHDGPVQHMYAALSQLDLMEAALERSTGVDPEVLQRKDRIRKLLEDGLTEVRSFIGAFRAPEFEHRPLRQLIDELLLQHEHLTDTQTTLHTDAELPAEDLPVRIALYRILQEGLSNAYRHGGASRVTVSLRAVHAGPRPRLRLEIVDNGAGFDTTDALGEAHFGLRGMRDRVEMIGGSFELSSAPGKGTRVTVEVDAQ